jgi:hypothetical protein
MTKHIFVQLGFYMSNLQKVQLNTDLFSETREYLYTEKLAWLKAWLNKLN